MSLDLFNAVLSNVKDKFQESETIPTITELDSSVTAANNLVQILLDIPTDSSISLLFYNRPRGGLVALVDLFYDYHNVMLIKDPKYKESP